MKTEVSLRDEVEAALQRDAVTACETLRVDEASGVVSLFGEVHSYAARVAAETAVKRVPGVSRVMVGITVHPSEECRRADATLATSIRCALRRNANVPSTVRAKVEKGWVTLKGEVSRYAQRDAAERTIAWLDGVLGVTNEIVVEAECSAAEAAETMRAASARKAVVRINSRALSSDHEDRTIH